MIEELLKKGLSPYDVFMALRSRHNNWLELRAEIYKTNSRLALSHARKQTKEKKK